MKARDSAPRTDLRWNLALIDLHLRSGRADLAREEAKIAALKKAVAAVRENGWATAANQLVPGVNALAAPIFDHREAYTGAVAVIGSSHLISATPSTELIGLVTHAAQQISRALGSTNVRIQGDKV